MNSKKHQPVLLHEASNEMKIDTDYLIQELGPTILVDFLKILKVNDWILTYLMPWISALTVLTNLTVSSLCLGIYIKTKRTSHKPAFVFIGFLALIDVIFGM